MNVLSLFDGISCGQVALERAGIKVDTYYASEIDKDAVQNTQKRFPNTVQLGDVTQLNFANFKHCDLLIGGSPCQSLSIVQSKTRKNLFGKSRLFFEFVRAFETIRPKWFLFENVASMNSESKEVISDLLCCKPMLINSNCFSAQDRPRYYWTNIPLDTSDLRESSLCLSDILEKEVPEKYWYSYPITNVNMAKQVCATMEHNNHEIHKRVFNPAFKCHTLTAVCGGNQQKKVLISGRVRKLTPLEYERLQTLPDNYTAFMSDSASYKAIGNGWTVNVIAHIFKNIVENEAAVAI